MWETIDYNNKNLDQMVEMARENYGNIEIANREFLKWQYFKNPAGNAIIKLAYDNENDKLAGQYIVIPFQVKIHQEEVICVNSLDTLTQKKYRKQGIFKTLTTQTYELCKNKKYPFVIIFPNNNSRKGFLKYFKFYPICRFQILFKITICVDIKKGNRNIIHEINYENIELFDSFWERIKRKYDNLGVRNAAYMRWRYLDIPLRKYSFYGIIKDDVLHGYVTGTIKKIGGIRTGIITDFLITNDCDEEDIKGLINYVYRDFVNEGVFVSMTFLPKYSNEYSILIKNGYVKWPFKFEPRLFEVYKLNFDHEKYLETANTFHNETWFTTIGDYLLV